MAQHLIESLAFEPAEELYSLIEDCQVLASVLKTCHSPGKFAVSVCSQYLPTYIKVSMCLVFAGLETYFICQKRATFSPYKVIVFFSCKMLLIA